MDLCERLGGAERVVALTGSSVFERFSGPQIAKVCPVTLIIPPSQPRIFQVARRTPDVYAQTKHIRLISAFLPSVLVGSLVPTDASDASGMTLMDIRTRTWSEDCLTATAPGLRSRLGELASPLRVAGPLARYFCIKFGFSPECCVMTGTGDNVREPSSISKRFIV